MVYKPVFVGDFEFDFKRLSHDVLKTEQAVTYIGKTKRKDTARILIKGPGIITIPENIKKVIIRGFMGTNTLEIPKSVKALKISSQTLKKFDLSIPDTLKELDIFSQAKIQEKFDISKLKKLKAFSMSYAPELKSIGKLPENLEYLNLYDIGLKTFPKNLPISLRKIVIRFFKNIIDFPDLSYLKNLTFIGIEHTAISKFSKTPPSQQAYLYFIEIPGGSAKFPDNYKERPGSLRIFTNDPYYHVVDGRVVFKKT